MVPFPERRGEPDCVYYMRTGLCGFGMNCRFNHPSNRKLALALSRDKGEYPERIGQPECQYYLKTGTCKFGLICKYHHSKERAGSWGRVTTNFVGLPLRPGEKDCAYYMRNGLCKFGITCKFNHPQPATFGGLVAMSGSSAYVSAGLSSTPQPQPFRTGLPSWQVARAPYISSSRFQCPSSFAPLIVQQPQNLVSLPGWSAYQAQMRSLTSLETQQRTLGSSSVYGATAPTDASSDGVHPSYNPYLPGSAATGFPSMQVQSTNLSRDMVFPERPGLPECQYYMRTGDCKFGMSCRYHHPREQISSGPSSILSPIGLPLRPGVPQCRFYSRHGVCKFGPTCKFDHPMNNLTYSPSASSLLDMPIAPYPVGSSSAFVASSSETTIQGPKNLSRETGSPLGENKAYKSSYVDVCTDEIPSKSVQSGTSSTNRSLPLP